MLAGRINLLFIQIETLITSENEFFNSWSFPNEIFSEPEVKYLSYSGCKTEDLLHKSGLPVNRPESQEYAVREKDLFRLTWRVNIMLF